MFTTNESYKHLHQLIGKYKFDDLYDIENKISISNINSILSIKGNLNSFSNKDIYTVKILCQIYKNLAINTNSTNYNESLFKIYENSTEIKNNVTHLHIKFNKKSILDINILNKLGENIEYLSLDMDHPIYSSDILNLDLSSINNLPINLKTLIIHCAHNCKYILCPSMLNYGLETLILRNVSTIPNFSTLPPTVKILVIIFHTSFNNNGLMLFNNRDFVNDLSNLPYNIEHIIYEVKGFLTNINISILPKTLKSLTINIIQNIPNEELINIKNELINQINTHIPSCYLIFEPIIV